MTLSSSPGLDVLSDRLWLMPDGRYHDLRLSPVEARAHFLANFLEVCRLNHHGCPWSLRRVTNESRVGELTEGLHPDYQASKCPSTDRIVVCVSIILQYVRDTAKQTLICDQRLQLSSEAYVRIRTVGSPIPRQHQGDLLYVLLLAVLIFVCPQGMANPIVAQEARN